MGSSMVTNVLLGCGMLVEKKVVHKRVRDRGYLGTLYSPLNFALNLKLFKEINSIFKKDISKKYSHIIVTK